MYMKYILQLQNLKCEGCSSTILKNISKRKGVSNAIVDVNCNSLEFEAVEDFDLQPIKNDLLHLGYPVIDEENPLSAKVKSYLSCAIGKLQKNTE